MTPAEPAAAEPPAGPDFRELLRWLLTPARSGVVVTRDDLARIAAALGFAVPALDRRIMLEHLFVAAGPAGLLPRLLDLLAGEVDTWAATYRAWEAACPHSAPLWRDWRARAEALRAALEALRVEAERPP
jgi:hypothetical protein